MTEDLLARIDIKPLLNAAVAHLPNLLMAIVLVGVFWLINRAVARMLRVSLAKTAIPPEAQTLLLRFARYTVYVLGFITVADQVGINITALVAGAGVAGLAVSFAAQETIANIISGIAIIVDRPFAKGDWISIGDLHAVVDDIRLRTTILTTFDNESLVVPNQQLAKERIINYTLTPRVRVRVSVGIAYKEDIAAARRVMLATLEGDALVLDEPAPVVHVMGLGNSSVDLQMRFWTEKPDDKFPLIWKYTEACKTALDEAGIQIPFPHLQMFLEKSEGLDELVSRS